MGGVDACSAADEPRRYGWGWKRWPPAARVERDSRAALFCAAEFDAVCYTAGATVVCPLAGRARVARDFKSLVGEVSSLFLHPARRADGCWRGETRFPGTQSPWQRACALRANRKQGRVAGLMSRDSKSLTTNARPPSERVRELALAARIADNGRIEGGMKTT